MRIRELECFVAVAEELHFGHAAIRLNLAQQPLSQTIRRLEDRLGVRLFDRSTRHVALTAAGAALLPEVRSALRHVRAGVSAAQRSARDAEARLILGYPSTALYSLLPSLLRSYRTACPNVTVVPRELCTPDGLAALQAGEVHAALIVTEISSGYRVPVPADVRAHPLIRTPILVALPAAHPLGTRSELSLADLADAFFVMYAQEHKAGLHEQVLRLCVQAGFTPKVAQEADTEQAVLSFVAVGLGVSLLPGDLQHLRGHDVVYRPLVRPRLYLSHSLATPLVPSPAVRALLSCVQSCEEPSAAVLALK